MDDIQVVAEPHRRHILRLIWDQERSAGDIASEFAITFGAVSQHLAVLRASGFVTVRPEGNLRMYRADKDALGPLRPMLEAMWAQKLDDLARTVEEGQS